MAAPITRVTARLENAQLLERERTPAHHGPARIEEMLPGRPSAPTQSAPIPKAGTGAE